MTVSDCMVIFCLLLSGSCSMAARVQSGGDKDNVKTTEIPSQATESPSEPTESPKNTRVRCWEQQTSEACPAYCYWNGAECDEVGYLADEGISYESGTISESYRESQSGCEDSCSAHASSESGHEQCIAFTYFSKSSNVANGTNGGSNCFLKGTLSGRQNLESTHPDVTSYVELGYACQDPKSIRIGPVRDVGPEEEATKAEKARGLACCQKRDRSNNICSQLFTNDWCVHNSACVDETPEPTPRPSPEDKSRAWMLAPPHSAAVLLAACFLMGST